MRDTNILILDLGLNAYDSALRSTIAATSRETEVELVRLVPEMMKDSDWDGVLDKLLSAKRCITL